MKPLRWLAAGLLVVAVLAGCATLDEKQREWVFQPSDRGWGNSAEMAAGMEEHWIEFDSSVTGQPARLHALWAGAERSGGTPGDTGDSAPVLLYLHGARFNVTGSAFRIRRMQELGFSVLAIDYRGFGKSTAGLPSEETAYEDARAAWNWLRRMRGGQPRYIFGHSLGAAIAIELAAQVDDERGTLVEGSFTSIPDVVDTYKWGWLPVGGLITQRFEAVRRVGRIGSPLLVVHGANDSTIKPELGRRLYEAAAEPKRLVVVEGASHHNTLWMGQALYRQALQEMFGH
jgi:alpha-beta hydrolase superfamily lysophospholipase